MPQGQSFFNRFLRQPDNSPQDPFSNNLDPNNPSYPYSALFTALLAAIGFNVRTKAATDYYVDPSGGNDANTGAIGSPWRTFAHAIAVLITLDFAAQTVTLHLVNNATESLIVLPWTGGGALTFDGGGKSITTTGADAIQTNGGVIPGNFKYQNVTLSTVTSGSCVRHQVPGIVQQGPSVIFGSCAARHINVLGEAAAKLSILNDYTVNGGAGSHYGLGAAFLDISTPITVTLVGNPQFLNAFIFVAFGAADLTGFKFSGTGTGYQTGNIIFNGLLSKGSAVLPGNGTIATSTGGQSV